MNELGCLSIPSVNWDFITDLVYPELPCLSLNSLFYSLTAKIYRVEHYVILCDWICTHMALGSSACRQPMKVNGKCGIRLNAFAVCCLVCWSPFSWCEHGYVCVCVYSLPSLGPVHLCVRVPNLVLSLQSLSLMFFCCSCFLPCSNKASQSNWVCLHQIH